MFWFDPNVWRCIIPFQFLWLSAAQSSIFFCVLHIIPMRTEFFSYHSVLFASQAVLNTTNGKEFQISKLILLRYANEKTVNETTPSIIVSTDDEQIKVGDQITFVLSTNEIFYMNFSVFSSNFNRLTSGLILNHPLFSRFPG